MTIMRLLLKARVPTVLFTVHDYKFYIPLIGVHNITNALATIAAAVHVGLDPGTINDGFRALHLTGMRMEKILTLMELPSLMMRGMRVRSP